MSIRRGEPGTRRELWLLAGAFAFFCACAVTVLVLALVGLYH